MNGEGSGVRGQGPEKGKGFLITVCLLLSGCSGPLIEWQTTEEGAKRRAMRPLVFYEHKPDPPKTLSSFLWPLGSYRADLERAEYRLFPLYLRQSRANPAGPDWDAVTGFLLWHGKDPARGSYAAFFPVAGTMRNLFFKDRIDFFGFPLWSRVREGGNDSRNVLWPVFNRTSGPVTGWKLWPFYGRYRKTNAQGELLYERSFWLWPFFTSHKTGLDTKAPTRLFFSFPLYGSIESRSLSERSWLWPFFKHRVERGATPREDWRIPFPFVQIGNGAEYRRRDFWPFYGKKRTGTLERTYWLWPFLRVERRVDAVESDRRIFLLPFHWQSGTKNGAGDVTRSGFKLWPLYGTRREPDGARSTEILSPLWFQDKYGLEELAGPLWRLYGSRTAPDGRRKNSLLFGLYESDSRPDRPADWRILGGFLGRETTKEKEGKRKTRFLYRIW